MKRPRLYSLSELQRMLGVPRGRLSVTIDVLGIEIYRGHKNSKCVNDAGLRKLTRQLEPRPERVAI